MSALRLASWRATGSGPRPRHRPGPELLGWAVSLALVATAVSALGLWARLADVSRRQRS